MSRPMCMRPNHAIHVLFKQTNADCQKIPYHAGESSCLSNVLLNFRLYQCKAM